MEDTPIPPGQPAAPAKPRRRWLRFSLRTMLISVALLGIWLGVVANRANRQRQAVEAIRRSGGYLWYDYQTDGEGEEANNKATPPGPEWLRDLIGIDYLATPSRIVFFNASLTADAVAGLTQLPRLRNLYMSDESVTNSVLAAIANANHVRNLEIWDSSIDDIGWEALVNATQLEGLELTGDNVNDRTLSQVSRLACLTYLDLVDTGVTDAGLMQLKGLACLKRVDLNGNGLITEAGVHALQRAMPRTTIVCPWFVGAN